MDAAEARDFLREHHRAVVATFRADGRPHLSPVLAGVDEKGRVIISSTEDRVKVRNLRRDPRIAVCVFAEGFFGPWLQVEGDAEVVSLPEAMEPLVDYYRRIAGEHPDWDEYRAAMKRERRVLIRFEIARAIG
ncbi:PPOX class F420-dependent oxidoreductase [Carbonactinospora thermoautotrophica]|uniref:Pyridoxamine 5'-phosphate oxidase n=1 Tax=Carbonactinospora thermoautotrophica TaxID=1469144 RepID=A0A132N4Z4_9ACTN|nr:PPOX class F420-dependent oxidoreductase [Carbonactinospora thermoautotrophica]KWW99131.1 Pyridoxamine 5'-phosphate oxidase-related FMN-binding protein [Carbonactinospora thermoautotrophica]KWX05066.1 pyridoxamine 5'-phosphate oxidase [Carbonactinospora thermoautotrophica]KWX08121.1 pyridoxamine 5'-phosphate oxidase [Carbonactinospora thermoautotrophica]MCX9191667.1 PPOX class F420-dependent oxidoreductase [Carbonactinospora thermoautotrophica]